MSQPAEPTDWTLGALLEWTARFLLRKGSESPRLDAEVLLAHAVGCRRIDLYTRHDERATDETRQRFRELVRQRAEGCPVAYLVGRKEFYSLEFGVNRSVLIPRPESEFVVMECLQRAKALAAPRIVDIGTGSGAIAVTVAKHHPGAQVTAVDVSADALAVATQNAARHGVADRVRFLHGDLFGPVAEEKFDFILSNPPYIPHEELDRLPVGVRNYEPLVALDGGPGGYEVFGRLVADAGAHLVPGGWLIVEIGAPQEGETRRRIEAQADFRLLPTVHDYSGHPRVLCAQWRGASAA
ncbi:MAG: peptide chain release factor N(5)-glutamine methyltransferase [Gemmataceae bacterium]|nr:peptide chain release factor N(5)-glutamine methyltransferase [Gemmataceae bacterium]MDW8266192.1 peptide chain release factor N(5)-glutamine methyltransferase [Gemmataceae bacterium]